MNQINPAKKVPAIVDQGFPVWESRAIMQYLCNKYAPNSPLYPKDIQKRAVVDSLLYFDTTYYQSLRDALVSYVTNEFVVNMDDLLYDYLINSSTNW